MANRFQTPNEQFADDAGTPYAGGKLYFYDTGTTTPATTWSDSAQSVENSNPIVLDSAGQAGDIFLSPDSAYKVKLTDSDDVEIWTKDPIVDPAANVAIAGAAMLATEGQTITGGAEVTPKALGAISSGTVTPDFSARAYQTYTNNGAHTLAPPAQTGGCEIKITNGASAGAITTSGWDAVDGDSFTTTAAAVFFVACRVIDGQSYLQIKAF